MTFQPLTGCSGGDTDPPSHGGHGTALCVRSSSSDWTTSEAGQVGDAGRASAVAADTIRATRHHGESCAKRRRQVAEPRPPPPPARYLISDSILNIGMYMLMMMTPTIMPTPIIMIGSMIDVREAIEASTSSS